MIIDLRLSAINEAVEKLKDNGCSKKQIETYINEQYKKLRVENEQTD